jgi:DNA-binding NarL/FixJ family response regulator
VARILIADDHEIVRRAVRQLVEGRPGWEVCAEASTGDEAVRLAKELRPDVAVLDLSMPGRSGVDAIHEIRQTLADTKIVVFSMHDSNELTRYALAAGAHAYLLKSDAAMHIEPAIEAVIQGKGYFTPGIAATLVNAIVHDADKAEFSTQEGLVVPRRQGHRHVVIARGQSPAGSCRLGRYRCEAFPRSAVGAAANPISQPPTRPHPRLRPRRSPCLCRHR